MKEILLLITLISVSQFVIELNNKTDTIGLSFSLRPIITFNRNRL
ncbi:MAG: hypothetical protein Pg6A_06830 [Termitinemataceae bacterium]|nr:MAG: hypothetical protein Pg6A_06830 [Termitinemataceae bacterium]